MDVIDGSILLLYPDTREAALGSPGFREVFRTLSGSGGVCVDWGWIDPGSGTVTYERRESHGPYDVIGFSVPWEPMYTTVASGLLHMGIEPERARRGSGVPLVMVGGAAPTINPVPASVTADLVCVGEAECGLVDILKEALHKAKTGAARKLTPMSGMPVPETMTAAPRFISPPDLIDSSHMESFGGAGDTAFGSAGLVEVGRGCSRGCRFCAAGHVCLPARKRPVEAILADVDTWHGHTERIGLVGAALSDHPELKSILAGIVERGFGLTTSSFRADMIDDETAELLARGGLRSVAIAPEGGSERMRRIMNKRLAGERIIGAAQACARAGMKNLRLYFIVGAPWEEDGDIDAIIELTADVREHVKESGTMLTVSVNPFIPKPQTPFQWRPMADRGYIAAVLKRLDGAFRKMKGVRFKPMSIRMAEREAVISLGGEAVGRAVAAHVRDGVPWKKSFADAGVDSESLLYREKGRDEVFPWDRWCPPQTKTALWTSHEKARNAARNL